MFRLLLIAGFAVSTLTPAVAHAETGEAAPGGVALEGAQGGAQEDAAGKAPKKAGAKKSPGKKASAPAKAAPAKAAPKASPSKASPGRTIDAPKAAPAASAPRNVPVTHKVQTGAAVKTTRVGTVPGATGPGTTGVRVDSGHATANFRTSGVSGSASRTQGVQVHNSVAEHHAVSRHAHSVAVAHHRVAVVHHRAAVAAHHRAWAAHHRGWYWGHRSAYWRPWAPVTRTTGTTGWWSTAPRPSTAAALPPRTSSPSGRSSGRTPSRWASVAAPT